jgi:transcriptional regulator with XRE-family HTH domain
VPGIRRIDVEKREIKLRKRRNILSIAFGNAVKFWRKINQFDQKVLGDLLGTSRSYVGRLESGLVGISFGKIITIAEALGVSCFTLLHYPEAKEIEIIKDIYNDIDLEVTKQELETLWNKSFFTGEAVTFDNYRLLITDTIRGSID